MSPLAKKPPPYPARSLGRVATIRVTIPEGLKETVLSLVKNYSEAPLSEVERQLGERSEWRRFKSRERKARYRQRQKEKEDVREE